MNVIVNFDENINVLQEYKKAAAAYSEKIAFEPNLLDLQNDLIKEFDVMSKNFKEDLNSINKIENLENSVIQIRKQLLRNKRAVEINAEDKGNLSRICNRYYMDLTPAAKKKVQKYVFNDLCQDIPSNCDICAFSELFAGLNAKKACHELYMNGMTCGMKK